MDVRLQPSACNVLKNTTNKKKKDESLGQEEGTNVGQRTRESLRAVKRNRGAF